MGGGVSSDSLDTSKKKGDHALKGQRIDEAIYYYTRSISEFEEKTDHIETDQKSLAILYSNRSAAFEMNGQGEYALEDALLVINIEVNWVKGYFRATKALILMQNYSEAKRYILKALALEPSDHTLRSLYLFLCNQNIDDDVIKGVSSTYSWGMGGSGQLGIGTCFNKSYPTLVNKLRGKYIQDIACGAMHTCAVTMSGEVFAWGDNSYSQLGVDLKALTSWSESSEKGNSPTTIMSYSNSPCLIPMFVGLRITAISAGAGHTVVVTDSGEAFGWGMANHGQLGLGPHSNKVVNYPTKLPIPSTRFHVMSIACGLAHTFLLLSDDTVLCCGMNHYGQLGSNDNIDAMDFIKPYQMDAIRLSHISCGGAHTLLVTTAGALYSAGSNSSGQLGLGHYNDTYRFTPVVSQSQSLLSHTEDEPHQIAYVCCGEEYSLAITRASPGCIERNRVLSCGLGISGQLGTGDVENRCNFTAVKDLPDDVSIESLSCNQKQVFAICSQGDIYSWGLPFLGGEATELEIALKPIKIKNFHHRKVRQICCGRNHVSLLVHAPLGSMCEVQWTASKHLNKAAPDAPFVMQANESGKFRVITRNALNECVLTGGSLVVATVESAEAMSYRTAVEQRRVAVPLFADDKYLSLRVSVDDNMDGTYSCRCNVLISGIYKLVVKVDDVEVEGSPFTITVQPGSVCPLNCQVWWSAELSNGALQCEIEEDVYFTVSCKDEYGNRCIDLADTVIEVACLEPVQGVEQRQRFHRSSLGIFPCSLKCPGVCGEYEVVVSAVAGEGSQRLEQRTLLLVGPQTCVEEKMTQAEEKTAQAVSTVPDIVSAFLTEWEQQQRGAALSAAEEGRVLQCKQHDEAADSHTKEYLHLRRAEASRRAAAYQRAAAAAARLKERLPVKRVKRTGGGFIVQYSQDN